MSVLELHCPGPHDVPIVVAQVEYDPDSTPGAPQAMLCEPCGHAYAAGVATSVLSPGQVPDAAQIAALATEPT